MNLCSLLLSPLGLWMHPYLGGPFLSLGLLFAVPSAFRHSSFPWPTSLLAGQVVERLMAERGEQGLLGLCHRFRQVFVDTLQPSVRRCRSRPCTAFD